MAKELTCTILSELWERWTDMCIMQNINEGPKHRFRSTAILRSVYANRTTKHIYFETSFAGIAYKAVVVSLAELESRRAPATTGQYSSMWGRRTQDRAVRGDDCKWLSP